MGVRDFFSSSFLLSSADSPPNFRARKGRCVSRKYPTKLGERVEG